MVVWNGNLRNSPFDIAIDLQVLMSNEHWKNEHRIVIVALALVYLPQIIRLNTSSSTEGLSPYFLLFNAIYRNLQLAHALLLAGYGYPTTETPILALIGSGDVTGMKALGGVLGLLQVTCQWICSMILIILFSHHSSSRAASSNGNRTMALAVFAHATIFLVPAMLITLPTPAPREMGSSIFMGWSLILNTWVALCFVILQFWPQYLEMRRMVWRSRRTQSDISGIAGCLPPGCGFSMAFKTWVAAMGTAACHTCPLVSRGPITFQLYPVRHRVSRTPGWLYSTG